MDIPFDVTRIKLETARLQLRPFEATDLEDFYTYASVPEVGECAGWPHHESIKASSKILNEIIEKKVAVAIYHKTDKKVIGSISLNRSWTNRNDTYKHLKAKEIGFVLSKNYWGQGIMPEAVNTLVHYGFSELGLEAIALAHFGENTRSKRVAEKCGFIYIETGRFYAKLLNKQYDDVRYILTK